MANIDTPTEHKKKSQKRVDRQARKAEKRKQKELLAKHQQEKLLQKPVKARLSKKSLPGFLAKNADAILQWLKDYQTLFVMADDYGIQQLDRLPSNKRQLLVQNYIDVGDFILMLENIKAESMLSCADETKNCISNDMQFDLEYQPLECLQ